MSQIPLISICIPAFKRIEFLKRLLDSIASQSFRDFEVVITDDSPGDEVQLLCEQYKSSFDLHYFRNQSSLGTPENWNQAIRNSKGEWIKIMHDDDWFVHNECLQEFYNAVEKNPNADFFFCAYNNVDLGSGKKENVFCAKQDLQILKHSYLHLLKKNYVGNPSCTLIRRNGLFYDSRLKFVVDFDYYMQCFRAGMEWYYIDKVLLNVGINEEQVTKYTFLVPEIQIPENHLLLKKFGTGILKNIFVYDYFWRMYRNLGIHSLDKLKEYTEEDPDASLRQMIQFQNKIPSTWLRVGLISKGLMFLNYLRNLLRLA